MQKKKEEGSGRVCYERYLSALRYMHIVRERRDAWESARTRTRPHGAVPRDRSRSLEEEGGDAGKEGKSVHVACMRN